MRRVLAATILAWGLLPAVGCDDSQTPDGKRSSLLVKRRTEDNSPPPPPLPAAGAASGKAAEVDARMREFISVSNQMAEALASVRTPVDAERQAARIQPIVARQKALALELNALKLEIPAEEYRPVLARYQARIKTSGESAVQAHAKILLNLEMSAAWGRGLKASAATTTKVPASKQPQADFDQKLSTFLEITEQLNESFGQITAAMESVKDEPSARAAAARLRELTPPMEERFRKHVALTIRLISSGDFGRVMQAASKRGMQNRDGARMTKTVKRVAGGPYRDLMKPELRGIFEVMLRLATNQRQREHLQKEIRKLGLDR